MRSQVLGNFNNLLRMGNTQITCLLARATERTLATHGQDERALTLPLKQLVLA